MYDNTSVVKRRTTVSVSLTCENTEKFSCFCCHESEQLFGHHQQHRKSWYYVYLLDKKIITPII